jgi:hypothetical protein
MKAEKEQFTEATGFVVFTNALESLIQAMLNGSLVFTAWCLLAF